MQVMFISILYEANNTKTALIYRVPTGQGNLKKVGEFVWPGNGQGKMILDHADCRYL